MDLTHVDIGSGVQVLENMSTEEDLVLSHSFDFEADDRHLDVCVGMYCV